MLYYTLEYSHLNYGSEVWGIADSTYLIQKGNVVDENYKQYGTYY